MVPLRELHDFPAQGSLIVSIDVFRTYSLPGSTFFRVARSWVYSDKRGAKGTYTLYLGESRMYDGHMLLIGMDLFIINPFVMLDLFALVQEFPA